MKEKRVIHWASFFHSFREWFWVLIIIVGVIYFYPRWKIEIAELKSKTVEIKGLVKVPVPGESISGKIMWKTTPPCTVIVSSIPVDISSMFYERPWGIDEIKKDGKYLELTMFRPTGVLENEVMFRTQNYRLSYGNTFTLSPTKDVNNPFSLKEKRELFGYTLGGGWSACNKIYLMSGIYLKNVSAGRFSFDIGLVSRVSFPQQDLALEILLK